MSNPTNGSRPMRSDIIKKGIDKAPHRSLLRATLEQAMEQARRSHRPMTLLALDVDHFKSINDRFGHAVGDRVLLGVSDVLLSRLRAADKVFRVGGEEFLVVIANGDAAVARLRQELSSFDKPWFKSGGALLDNGYHYLYMAEALMGSPIVQAYGRVGTWVQKQDVEDVAVVLLRQGAVVMEGLLRGGELDGEPVLLEGGLEPPQSS